MLRVCTIDIWLPRSRRILRLSYGAVGVGSARKCGVMVYVSIPNPDNTIDNTCHILPGITRNYQG